MFCKHKVFIASFHISKFGQQLHFAVVGSSTRFKTVYTNVFGKEMSFSGKKITLVHLNGLAIEILYPYMYVDRHCLVEVEPVYWSLHCL